MARNSRRGCVRAAIIAAVALPLTGFLILVGIALYESFDEARKSGLRSVRAMQSYENEPKKHLSLNSEKPFGAVSIPVSVRDGEIYCAVLLGETPILCRLDTGNSAVLTIPSTVKNVKATLLRPMSRESPKDGAPPSRRGLSEEVLLPSIRWGSKPGFVLRDIPASRAFTTAKPPEVTVKGERFSFEYEEQPQKAGEYGPFGSIGLAAFRHVVLTIDTRAEKIIIRSSKYDITRPENRAKGSFLLSARREESGSVSGSWAGIPLFRVRFENWLTIEGTVNRRPVRFLVDSGHTGGGVTLSDALAKEWKIPERGQKITIGQAYGEVTGRYIPHARIEIGDLSFDCPAGYSPGAPDNLIGDELFRRARITIDYGRSRILVEPYDAEPRKPQ